MSIDHQLSELVASINIVIQYSLFIDAKIIIALILLLWKDATPKCRGNRLRNDSNFSTQ